VRHPRRAPQALERPISSAASARGRPSRATEGVCYRPGKRTTLDQRRPPQREVLLKIRVLYPVAMAAVIVAVDFAFFRNLFWERLMANIGIVLVFLAFYLRFFGVPSLPWK